jgi:hypothetical protein
MFSSNVFVYYVCKRVQVILFTNGSCFRANHRVYRKRVKREHNSPF